MNDEVYEDIPLELIIEHHNPLTEDSGWECHGMTKDMFMNISDKFILEQFGHLDYGTVREARMGGYLLEGEIPWVDEDEDEDEYEDDYEEEEEFDPSSLYDYHIARVAYLMKNPDPNPIDIDIDYHESYKHGYALTVYDGNHRLLASYLRGDETIQVDLRGFNFSDADPVEWMLVQCEEDE